MDIQDVIKTIEENKSQLGITLFQPAYSSDIKEFEASFNLTLPDEIKTFYRFCNGFESMEDWFRIIPLEEIVSESKKLDKNQFYIAEYMVYCDMWGITIDPIDNSYQISDFSFKTVLTNSFTEFLNRFLIGGVFEKGGLYDWKEQIVKGP